MYWAIHKGTPPRPGTYRVFGQDNLVLGFAYWFGTSWGHTYYSLDLVQSNPSRKKLTASQIEAWAYCKPGKKSEIALSLTTLRGIVQKALASPVKRELHVVILTPTHIDGTPVPDAGGQTPSCYIQIPAFVAYQHASLAEGSHVEVLAQNLHKPLRQWRNSTQDGSSWFEAVNLQKLPQAAGSVPSAPEFSMEAGCLVIGAKGKRKKLSTQATDQLKAMLAIEELTNA